MKVGLARRVVVFLLSDVVAFGANEVTEVSVDVVVDVAVRSLRQ